MRFAVIGDWGYPGTAVEDVVGEICDAGPFDFVLTTGDNFYLPDGRATEENFFRPARCLTDSQVTWRAAWGNHDLGGTDTRDVLGAERRYAFSEGDARFVVLDGNTPDDLAQQGFLIDELARGTRFSIVVVHQPVQTAGLKSAPRVNAAFDATIKEGGAHLVLQGDNHFYERIVQQGVTFVTSGGGGAPLTPCVRAVRGVMRCVARHHFLVVEVGSDAAQIEAVSRRGRVFDRAVILGGRARRTVHGLGL